MSISVKTFASSAEAATALSGDRAARFMGGGTLIMRAVNEGDQSFNTIVLANDPALKQVQPQGDRLVIGAGVTMAQILASRDLDFSAPGGPCGRRSGDPQHGHRRRQSVFRTPVWRHDRRTAGA